jgi:hypothetical protein
MRFAGRLGNYEVTAGKKKPLGYLAHLRRADGRGLGPSTAALTQHREKATAAALGLALLVRREWGWQSLPHYWGPRKG